ncbi:MAG: XrtA/PEP-CTERM system histidine kinase PrsK, partial [Pseudomonadota bacterium]
REEWLKLIGRLAQDSERAPMPVLCLEALADIVDSDGGALWQRDAANPHLFRVQASFNYRHSEPELARSHPLIAFLASTGWVVDGRQAIQNPEHYSGALTSVQALVSEDVLFIPLMLDDTLTGVVSLSRPTAMPDLNFEDHDLLRTVGRQLAVFLEQTRVQQQLTQARQFEVFNRFSAFVMHDLKNLIAQQSLVVSNAVKHKSNPAFVEDAIGTIENSVRRMNRLLEQLQSGGTVGTNRTVDVLVLVADACKQAADRKPQPVVIKDTDAARLPMFGDAEKLASAIHHLLRNAQDATPSDGTISVTVSGLTNDGNVTSTQPVRCKISIADTGTGMDRAFIERRLFEPFDSTKGAKGMGIGMYQARDYIESLSGTLDVESTPGEGTTMHVVVPLTFSLQAD